MSPPAVPAPDARVFRELLGASGLRFTWVLTRTETRVSLRGSCQAYRYAAKSGRLLKIDGTEDQASKWREPLVVELEGKPGNGLTFDLTRTQASAMSACPHRSFARASLVCTDGDVDAVSASAVLVPASARQTMATWKPATRQHARALRCRLSELGRAPSSDEDLVVAPELVFAASTAQTAGVEWVEAVTKDGTYRFLPAP